MALCGLDLKRIQKGGIFGALSRSKTSVKILASLPLLCSYCQRGLERGMWPSRCNLPCASWPSAEGLAQIFWRTVGICFVLHTGRVMSGVWVLICDQALGVLELIPRVRGACALHWSMLKWPPSSGEVTQLRAVGSEFFTCWLLRGYTYMSLALWLYLASLPVTHCFLGHRID